MRKRQFLGSLLSATGVLLVDGRRRETLAAAAVSRLGITRIRLYEAPQPRPYDKISQRADHPPLRPLIAAIKLSVFAVICVLKF